MQQQSFEINMLTGYTPNEETEKLRRAVKMFHKRIRPGVAEIETRNAARLLIHSYEHRRGEQLKRSRLNF